MIGIRAAREAVQTLVGKMFGVRPQMPTHFVRQIETVGKVSEVKALPQTPSEPIQILDPDDSSFGSFIFMPGYDDPFGDVILP